MNILKLSNKKMKSNWESIDYHERIRDCELRDARIEFPRRYAEIQVSEHARKFCQNGDYYDNKNLLLLEIKNEIEKIGINNRDLVLEYVLGEPYKQRDKTIYITNKFENRYFFAGYKQSGDRINEDNKKVILISAIYCCRTAEVWMPKFVPMKRSRLFWQNLRIDALNAQEEAMAKIPPLTHMEVFFICLAACEKYM